MRWPRPFDRREILLIVFCLFVFTVAYNLETALQGLGLDSVQTQGFIRRISLGRLNVIGKDGRKLPAWRDSLEDKIFGDWEWEPGHVAGEGHKGQELGGIYEAMWAAPHDVGSLTGGRFTDKTVNDGLRQWGHDIPQTKMVKTVPGYTIIDNIVFFNGTIYIVTDNREAFPDIGSMVSHPTWRNKWEFIAVSKARETFGWHGGMYVRSLLHIFTL